MRKRRHKEFLAIALGAAMIAAPAYAQSDNEDESHADLVHSDLPLFVGGTSERWPQSFSNAETGEFGCASRVAFGDWILRAAAEPGDDEAVWRRFSNYGAFHCFALVSEADDREGLEEGEAKPSFFINLGMSGGVELWAAQIGARPGSDYLLLSRQPASGAISDFTVLQRQCPRRNLRDAGTVSILVTRYCAINSRAELRGLAKRMARLKPLGRLTFVEAPK